MLGLELSDVDYEINSFNQILSWFGDHSANETPDPIPNSEVKHGRADGTAA